MHRSGLLSSRTRSVLIGALLTALPSLAAAQASGPQWVALDPAVGPGTPPSVVVNSALTNMDQTVLTVAVPGFYVENIVAPDGNTYKRITLPGGTDTTDEAGKPMLPEMTTFIGIPSDVPAATREHILLARQVLTGYSNVMPVQPDVEETETSSPDAPAFQHDDLFYRTSVQYPFSLCSLVGGIGQWKNLRVQPIKISPFTVNPATGELDCARQMQIIVHHDGNDLPPARFTKRAARMMRTTCPNFDHFANLWLTNEVEYKGHYLIVCKTNRAAALDLLVDQKHKRGYEVTIATEHEAGVNGAFTAASVESYIDDWYARTSDEADSFVLLIGDVEELPLTNDPTGTWISDYAYGCVGSDPFPEMLVGRMTCPAGPNVVINATHAKTRAYMDNPPNVDSWYHNTMLVGHRQASAHFVETLEKVVAKNQQYTWRQSWNRFYGTEIGGQYVPAWDALSNGPHVVYYRGHGSPRTWSEWDYGGQSQSTLDMPTFYGAEFPERTPIMISSACSNGGIQANDKCWTEAWMEHEQGAVAAYGALGGSWRNINHSSTEHFFDLTFDTDNANLKQILDTALCIATLEHAGAEGFLKNLWTYDYLGDPDLNIWKENPRDIATPNLLPDFPFNNPVFPVYVTDATGAPVAGQLVSLRFCDSAGCPSSTGAFYTNAAGIANVPVHFTQPGTVEVEVFDVMGHNRTIRSTVEARCPADINNDGGVDGDDVIQFFTGWDRGNGDFNNDGGTDGDDVIDFFGRWDSAC